MDIAFEYADESLKKDREFILKAVKQYGYALEYADESLKKDREIVLKAVKQNGYTLEYADESLKKDREIVLKAVKQNGYALEYADESLKKDREIVLEAVKQNGSTFEYADESLKKDREIILEAVKQNGNIKFILEAVKQDGYTLEYADESFKKDREFILEAVKQHGRAFEYADESFKKDREFILKAVKQDGYVLEYADESLKKDMKIISSLPNKYSSKTAKYKFLKKVDTNSINQKLSKGIVEYYNKKFCEENDLFCYLFFKDIFPNEKPNFLNFRSNYSPKFIEKLIIIQILKNISSINPSSKPHIFKTFDYYLFCFKLYKFFEEYQSKLNSTYFSNIKSVVDDIASKFEVYYSDKEVEPILHFYEEWTSDLTIFDNPRELIAKYNEYQKNIVYELVSVLGYGAEGVVFKAFNKETNQYVAFKISYEYLDVAPAQERINFLKSDIEGKIKCYEANQISNHLYTVMEIGEESLSDYINRNSEVYTQKSITKDYLIEILTIFTKILYSVQTIHDHNIIHRDLDPKNIVKVSDQYKIIDFDIAKVAKTGKSITLTIGKLSYMSPEVSQASYREELLDDGKLVQNIGNISTMSDIFSMGCILLKLLTNSSLMLDKKFLQDANVQKYAEQYRYFVWDGVYFHTVLTELLREKKLHHAIQKTIDQYIDPNFGVNTILTRCLITMIQQDPNKRLMCYTHRTILLRVINYLKDNSSESIELIQKEMEDKYSEISELKEIPQIVEENEKLKQENKELKKENMRIKELEEEIRKLKLLLK
ncbi:predicted protein [Naegleria gruberi]|uniref:Predicted protein n=1 Tax=Naegleria gruberi TaxID=5762 RepID=D2VF70_NAEGR|nr:uncharacterized protein NAEGRDRAFT_79712 [Naegleria gruberi]EFC44723.1 predicted protein [Naegleria gruberi]|eukprot:XP_002677467.1 predicted protein [Naegleria gruberi strain NEG-M]